MISQKSGTRSHRGNSMLEFALASAVLVPCLAGTFQFGYTFYLYNLLEAAVSNGARYASMRTYRSQSSTDITKVQNSIQNMVVYGSPTPANGSGPVVPGLTTGNVKVSFALDLNGIPTDVTVSINSFTVDAVFQTFTFAGKPTATIPYLGRYAPNESEP